MLRKFWEENQRSTSLQSNSKRIFAKKSQLHCTESAVLFFSFLASSGR